MTPQDKKLNQLIEKNFIKTIKNLIDQMIKMYPTVKEFTSLKIKISMLPESLYGVILLVFKSETEKYKEQISKKDEKFFLSMDFTGSELEQFNYLKKVYQTSTDETKQNIWKYVTILQKISDKYKM